MWRRTIIPILGVLALLMLAPTSASAEVRFGIYLGGPPVVVVPPAPAYPGPYWEPYYLYGYSYGPVIGHGYRYALPAPRYYYPPAYYVPHYRDRDWQRDRGHARHEFRGGGHGGRRR